MTTYERNLEVLAAVRKDIYDEIENAFNPGEQVLTGDALDGEKFLAVIRGEEITPLSSTYHPAHEASRYVQQFAKAPEDSTLLLFGFGSGGIVEQILSRDCPVSRCVVYEPSVAIFRKALEEYDLREILGNPDLMLFVEGINGDGLERFLEDVVTYSSWRHFSLKALTWYRELFPEQYREVRKVFDRICDYRRADMNTLIALAKCSLENEVRALKWIIDCRTITGMKGMFPADIPGIVVAAGPSLEKNVEVLKQAKGRAFIICVDSAVPYLLKHSIVPDMICTVDARKGLRHFAGEELHNLPIAVSSDTNYKVLDYIGDVNPYYMSIANDYYQALFRRQGDSVGYFDGGGSVATVCFQMCVDIGLQTIILIGQDLAFTDARSHAGREELNQFDLESGINLVEGYDGGKVMTRGDFKTYIDWYNLRIPELKDCKVINATEGGAKLKGTEQMTLQEAVDTYCRKECDVAGILAQVPYVWETREEKEALYQELKRKYKYFTGFHRRVKEGVEGTRRAIRLLKRKNYQQKELQDIDRKLNVITEEVGREDGMVILVKRMIETDITLTDDLNEAEEDLEQESIRLYEKMQKYLGDLSEALEEMLPFWKETLEQINEKYQFDSKA